MLWNEPSRLLRAHIPGGEVGAMLPFPFNPRLPICGFILLFFQTGELFTAKQCKNRKFIISHRVWEEKNEKQLNKKKVALP